MVNTDDKSAEAAAAATAEAAAGDNNEDDPKQALLKGDGDVNGDGGSGDDEVPVGKRLDDIEMAVVGVPEVAIVGCEASVNGDVEAGDWDGAAVVKKSSSVSKVGSSNSVQRPCQQEQFGGLTKAELEVFANDPFWQRLRLILFVLFWVVWVAMFAAVIVIIVLSPKCPPRQARQFWQRPFYRVQVRSFAPDPASPAVPSRAGSLAGFEARLPYLRDTMGLSNFLLDSLVRAEPASGCPRDFAASDPSVGGLDRLRAITKLGRKKGFQLMMELDLSQADPGWQLPSGSQENRTRFVRDATNFEKMLSRDGKAAWSDQVLHMPRSACNSINVSSERVRQALFSAMSAWLDAGLSGFQLTNVAFLVPKKTNQAPDVTPKSAAAPPSDWYRRDPRIFLFSDEAVAFVRAARAFLDAEAARRGAELALFVDFGDLGGFPVPRDRLAAFAGPGGAHAILHTGLGSPLASAAVSAAADLRDVAESALANVSKGGDTATLAWVTNGPSLRRDPSPARAVLGLTLPGVGGIYYGQELGMGHVPGVQLLPPAGYLSGDEATDSVQTPMQWSDDPASAGWLPVNETAAVTPRALTWTTGLELRRPDILSHNLRRLKASGHPDSNLQLVQQLIKLVGGLESLQWGGATFAAGPRSPELVVFTRRAVRFPAVLVVVNSAAGREFIVAAPAEFGSAGARLELVYSWDAQGSGVPSGSKYTVGKSYASAEIFVPERTALVFVSGE